MSVKDFLPSIITGGTSVAGAAITAKGNKEAAEIQAKSDAEALAQAKEIYEQQRADQGPYRQSGYGSLNALNFGLGLPDVQLPGTVGPAPKPMSTLQGVEFPGAPQMPTETLTALNQQSQAGSAPWNKVAGKMTDKMQQAQTLINEKYGTQGATVKIKAPNGLVYIVPNDQVENAKQRGGVVV